MDALTKRLVWSNIQRKMAEGKTSVILTSHSMEECEVIRGFLKKDVHWNHIAMESVFLPLGFVLKASHNGTWPIRLLGQLISPKTKVTYRVKIYFHPRSPHVIPLVLVNLTFTQTPTYEVKNYFLTVVCYILYHNFSIICNLDTVLNCSI